jgi:hypothetical protein
MSDIEEIVDEDVLPPFAAVMAFTAMTGSDQEVEWASKLVAQMSAVYMTEWDALVAKGLSEERSFELTTDSFNLKGVDVLRCVGLGDAIEDLVREHQEQIPSVSKPETKRSKLIVPPSVVNGENIIIPHA